MRNNQEKLRAKRKFEKLAKCLNSHLGGKKRRIKIIRKVNRETPKGGEKEGVFIKLFLTPVLTSYFEHWSIEVIIEGVNSNGRTQFQDKFFGTKPAVDFLFEIDKQKRLFSTRHPLPFPLNTVGEVKYGKLTFRSFVTGLGQIIGYLNASKKFDYGYYIFFNTDIDKTITDRDRRFLDELWEKENIFVVII